MVPDEPSILSRIEPAIRNPADQGHGFLLWRSVEISEHSFANVGSPRETAEGCHPLAPPHAQAVRLPHAQAVAAARANEPTAPASMLSGSGWTTAS